MDLILPTTPDAELHAMLEGYSATLIAGGHTHVQMLRRNKNALVVNVGSVGLPFDRYLPVPPKSASCPGRNMPSSHGRTVH